MADPVVVEVPLVNPNEPDALVVDVAFPEGGYVSAGDVLCSLETSKSVEDVYAEVSGYVFGLAAKLGSSVTAGNVLCYLSEDPQWTPPAEEDGEQGDDVPEDLRITEPALAVARELGLDLSTLPVGVLITERHVREAADVDKVEAPPADPSSVIVFGAGGHGKTLIELIREVGQLELVGVVDDRLARGSDVLGVRVLGNRDDLASIRHDGIGLAANAIGGISNMASRVEVSQALAARGFVLPALIHPTAFVEASASIGEGAQILAHSYVGSDAVVGKGVIVNTGAVVSHDCVLEDHVNLSPGCLLAGGITVGEATLLGMGVTTYLGIDIGANVRAGNGAIITAPVPDGRRIATGSVWES
ncbi:MAG: NeuD/PglB/VioB family sugar acetyltransferase [Acidimicrobiia bacterium]